MLKQAIQEIVKIVNGGKFSETELKRLSFEKDLKKERDETIEKDVDLF